MTIQQRLLNSLFVLPFLFSLSAFAVETEYCPREFEILVRDKDDKYHFEKKVLDKLFCTNKFEGENFKIVHKTSEESISFTNADASLIKRAANVYYHLTVARNYWVKQLGSNYVQTLPQLTIRLDITNAFSNTRHFKNAELEKNYNNAWSIPEGETPRFVQDKQKWGKEIWFSPMKKLETRKLVQSEGNNPIHESLVLVKDPILEFNKNALIYQGLTLLVAPAISNSAILEASLKSLGMIAILYGAIEVSKHADHWFMDKYYFIDTAMVPEVIYHEFAHIAMSDSMKTVHSIPVIEGMADYFAAAISKRKNMYEKIKDFSSNKAKNTKSKELYHPYLEGEWNSTSDFTLSLLWLARMEFEKLDVTRAKRGQESIVNYDALIYKAHYDLTENSDIANDLNNSLVKACKELCTGLRPGINTLNNVFERKGFN